MSNFYYLYKDSNHCTEEDSNELFCQATNLNV